MEANRKSEQFLPGMSPDVADCSDERYHCLKSYGGEQGVAKWVLPKSCAAFRKGSRWSAGGMTTIKLRRSKASDVGGAGAWYLTTQSNRWVVLRYAEREGVTGVYISGGGDLASEIRAGDGPAQLVFIGGAKRRGPPLDACR